MQVTNENYHSKEARLAYMGASQYKNFKQCEALGMAIVTGEWEPEQSVSMLVGSYVDAHFERTLDLFKAQHPQIFTKQGELKSEYKKAEIIIARIERDEMFMRYMGGELQVIKTGVIAGVPFKIKIDSYLKRRAIVDLKIMKDFERIWVEGEGKVPFVEAWGYDIQGAIYQAVEGDHLPFIIAGATKETEPDLALLQIPQDRLDVMHDEVEHFAPVFDEVKKGLRAPTRCEKCDYCKSTKKLITVVDYREV
jgi:hypothetical protein